MRKYTKEYLDNLLSINEESKTLEFKSGLALSKESKKKTELSRDVSSFANSQGGMIIYGISEDKENRDKAGEYSPVDRKEFSKEWLEQVINSNIKPKIEGVYIEAVEIGDKVAYIVEIPQSDTVHQASDKKYYKRYNFMRTDMEDYEIRDVMNRMKTPKIELKFNTITSNNPKSRYKTQVFIVNTGTVVANYITVKFKINRGAFRVDMTAHWDWNRQGFLERKFENIHQDVLDSDFIGNGPVTEIPILGPSRYKPLLPTESMKVDELEYLDYSYDEANIISWRILADNAHPKTGQILISNISNSMFKEE